RVPFTTGLLIGIGETRRERLESLFAIREIHERYGHIQEIIIQNFRAKPGTKMANAAEPTLEEHLWTIAAARILFGPQMTLQAPPNLRPGALSALVRAGVNDWSPRCACGAPPSCPRAPVCPLFRQVSKVGAGSARSPPTLETPKPRGPL